jgi:hypothetical protein
MTVTHLNKSGVCEFVWQFNDYFRQQLATRHFADLFDRQCLKAIGAKLSISLLDNIQDAPLPDPIASERITAKVFVA